MVQKKKEPQILKPSEVSLADGGIMAYSDREAEKILIMMSYQEAARQIHNHTASASTINHFLKLGSERERLERERIINENKLSEAKVTKMSSESQAASDSKRAIEALKSYSPSED